MTLFAGATPVRRLALRPPTFELDLDEIGRALTPRTRAVILNSAQNPTGACIWPTRSGALAGLLEKASAANGRPVYLFSDEAYSRIVYGGRRFETPTAFYPYSFLIYTYGKVLLIPGSGSGTLRSRPRCPAATRCGRRSWRRSRFKAGSSRTR